MSDKIDTDGGQAETAEVSAADEHPAHSVDRRCPRCGEYGRPPGDPANYPGGEVFEDFWA